MKTLLVITPGRSVMQDSMFHILVAETGEHLASHFCSNSSFAYGDLYARMKERIKEWTERFGELEVKYIDETDITEEQLVERNKKWYAETQAKVSNEMNEEKTLLNWTDDRCDELEILVEVIQTLNTINQGSSFLQKMEEVIHNAKLLNSSSIAETRDSFLRFLNNLAIEDRSKHLQLKIFRKEIKWKKRKSGMKLKWKTFI